MEERRGREEGTEEGRELGSGGGTKEEREGGRNR